VSFHHTYCRRFYIPSEINGAAVTKIGYKAFFNYSNITSVQLPDTITEISASAFEGCSALNQIIIPDGVSYIGGGAFKDCISLSEFQMPDSVTDVKGLYLATHVISKKWTMPLRNWGKVLGELEIMYPDRLA